MSRISGYDALTAPAAGDLLVIVDVSDEDMAPTGTEKKITVTDLLAGAPGLIGLAPSGDSTGAADYANIAGLLTLAGQAVLQAGTFYVNQALSVTQAQNLTGAGEQLTGITCTSAVTGTGLMIGLSSGTTFTGGQYGGSVTGFTLYGYSAGGSANGVQYGNLQGLDADIAIEGFGGIGWYGKNSGGGWSEQNNIRLRLIQNGIACVLDTSSFDYSNYDLTIVTGNGGGGLALQNGAQFQGGQLRMRGNFYGTSVNTAAVIAIDPAGGPGTSYIRNTLFDVAVESAGSGQGPYLVYMGSTSAASQLFGTGVLTATSIGGVDFQGISNASFLPFGFTGMLGDQAQGTILSYGYQWLASTDGTATSNGAVVLSPYQGWFGIYDSTNALYFGISAQLPSPSGTSTLGGYYYGLGIGGSSNGAGHPIFGVLTSTQSGQGLGSVAFTVLDTNKVYTYNNTLDNGSGAAAFTGVVALEAGTDTSGTATESAPSFTTATARQLSTTQDVELYISVGTSVTATVAFGSTSSAASTLVNNKSLAAGQVISFKVPKGWYVEITCATMSDLVFTQVTC